MLGPIFVLKLKRFTPPELGRRLVAELWLYPDGSRILELSTKCRPARRSRWRPRRGRSCASTGIDVTAGQQTKTATALRYFARQLASS